MAIVVKLTGDLSDLEAKMKSAGIKVEQMGDKSATASGQAADFKGSLDKVEQSLANMEAATVKSADAMMKLEGGSGIADSIADGFGNSERVLLGVNDMLGVMAEQFGINLGPAQEWAQAAGDVAGGLEGIIGGGQALIKQIGPMLTGQSTVIASTWAHVTALYAQAAAFVAANLPMIAIIATIALVAGGVVLLIKHWDDITAKFPVLGEATDAIKGKLSEFADWITQTFIPAAASLYDPAIKAPLELIVAFFKVQFDLVKVGVETVLGVIKGIVDVFMGVFTGDWDRAWAGVKQIVDSLWSGIKEAFSLGIAFFRDELVPKVFEAGSMVGGALMDGIKSALGAVAGFAGGVADAVLSAVRNVVNSYVIDPINRTLEFGFDTHIPGVGTVNINPPDLPRLASGMWNVPGPTGVDQFPALLAGGEMVVSADPAEKLRELLTVGGLAGGGGGGGTNTIKIGVASDGVSDMEKANAELTALLRLLAALDKESQDMWLADPKNAEFLANLRRAAAGLGPMTPSIGDGPVFSPGAEGGGGLPTPSRPVVGGSGATNGAGGGSTAGGGAGAPKGPSTEELLGQLVALAERDRERTTQGLTLMNRLIEMLAGPQTVEIVAKQGALQALAAALFDPLAQISRRQWSPA